MRSEFEPEASAKCFADASGSDLAEVQLLEMYSCLIWVSPLGAGIMSSIPVEQTPPAAPGETVEQRFRQLAAGWRKAVAYSSSTTELMNHPAYQAIIALGSEVVPFLLRDLEENHTHWFYALCRIAGANPIPETAAGNIPKMAAAWLHWAKENEYQR
jgi:hypothetical protein